MEGKPCRLCEETLGMTREQVRALVEKTRLDESQELADDDAYERRLDACEACPSLNGATCMQCGCIVPLRAMQRAGRCPHPGGSRWSTS